MSKAVSSDPRSLAKTQAESVPPPGPTVPEPPRTAAGRGDAPAGSGDVASVLHRVKELAREVGGIDRLRQIIDEMGEA